MVIQVRNAAILSILAIGVLSGCLFSPEKKAPISTPPPEYPAPRNVNQALLNMIAAYEARDSVGTEAIYDVNYQGSSVDLADPRPTITLSQIDERHHVAVLKLDPNIVSVTLNFGPQSSWIPIPPNVGEEDWKVLQINSANIEIRDANTGTTFQSQNNKMVYTFIPHVSTSGDTTWAIRRWEEIRT